MDIKELQSLMEETIQKKLDPIQQKQKEQSEKQLQYEETQRKYGAIFEEGFEPKEKAEPGMVFTRAIKCLTLAKNDADKALFYATGGEHSNKGMYPNDKNVHALLKSLSATTPSDGGFLINEQYARDIIPLLLAKTAVMELGTRRIPMPGGNLNMPRLQGGATSFYVGENQNATSSQEKFGNVKLNSKKLVTLVPVSNDLIRNSSPEADAVVRDDMVTQMRLKLDFVALYGDGTQFTPLGIKKGVNSGNVTIATGTGTLNADIPGLMIGTLMNQNVPMLSAGWIFPSLIWSTFYNLKTTTNHYIYRDEMNKGTLNGFPFKVSNQITTAQSTAGSTYFDIFFGDFSELIFGDEMAFEFMASNEASWYDGANLQSAFSLDQTVLKITAKHDFALRHSASFLVWNYPQF